MFSFALENKFLNGLLKKKTNIFEIVLVLRIFIKQKSEANQL